MATPRKAVEAFRERAELLDFLLEVSRITSETLDLDKLLANVADIVKVVVPYDLFAILLYSERNQGLRIRYSIGHREEIVRSMVIGLGEGIVGAAAQSREPVLVEDVRTDPRYLVALDAVQSELAVPMMTHGKLVGVIDVQSTRARAFHDQDRRIMRLIASRVAGSIENASLYRRVHQQNRTFRTLAQLSQEFSSILDLDELLGKIAASVRTLINYDAFSILLVDPGEARCCAPASAFATISASTWTTSRWERASPARRPNPGKPFAWSTLCKIRVTSRRNPIFIPRWPCR